MITETLYAHDLIGNADISFSDSESMIEEKYEFGIIEREEYECLMNTLADANTKQKVLDWKLEECDERFIRSVTNCGIRIPIAMVENEILNGHHRIAVAQLLGIKIPVDMYDTFQEFTNLHEWLSKGLIESNGEMI